MSLIVSDSLKGLIDEDVLRPTKSNFLITVNNTSMGDIKKIKFLNDKIIVKIFLNHNQICELLELHHSTVSLKLTINDNNFDIVTGRLIFNDITADEENDLFKLVKLTIQNFNEENND
tara:strand:- start:4796 stop:5149 length:354 start_codon:yes stop_codon:yes gene_type:complete